MFKGITIEFRKGNEGDNDYYAARVRPIGITAYGTSRMEAFEKLKKMFSIMVDANMKEVEGANP